jgi:hypothetical protein
VKPPGSSTSAASSTGWASGSSISAAAGFSVPVRQSKASARNDAAAATAATSEMSKISFADLKAIGKVERDKQKPEKITKIRSTPSPALMEVEDHPDLPKPPSPALVADDFPGLPSEKRTKNRSRPQASSLRDNSSPALAAAVIASKTPPPPPSVPSPESVSAPLKANEKTVKVSSSWVPKLGGTSETSVDSEPVSAPSPVKLDSSDFPSLEASKPAPKKAVVYAATSASNTSSKKIVVVGASGVKVMTTTTKPASKKTLPANASTSKLSSDLKQIVSNVK